MNRTVITTVSAITSALFLLVIGILHSVVNFSGLQRALGRGEIAARVGSSVLFNAVFSGVMLSLLGLIVFLVLPGLRAGSRQARRVALTIGTLIAVLGAVGYWAVPTRPTVLIFLFFGVLLVAPLLIWRHEYPNP